jgi:hypothetical protein
MQRSFGSVERFQFASAAFGFLEQARVLDGNRGLAGNRQNEVGVALGVETWLIVVETYLADDAVFHLKRNSQNRTLHAHKRIRLGRHRRTSIRIRERARQVVDDDRPIFANDGLEYERPLDRVGLAHQQPALQIAAVLDDVQRFSLDQHDPCVPRLDNGLQLIEHTAKQRPKVKCRGECAGDFQQRG